MRASRIIPLSELISEKTQEIFTGGWNINEYIKRIENSSVVKYNITNKWMTYLNESFHNPANCAYQSLVDGLQDLIEHNEVIITQTEHELRVSFELFEQIIDRKTMLVIRESWIARKLIMFTVIVSKYPGMVIRPVSKGIDKLFDQPTILSIDELFDHTFTKYQPATYLSRHFEFLNNEELLGLMRINQGTSPTRIKTFQSGLTRKEAQRLIFGIHNAFQYDSDILLRGKIICKMYTDKYELGLREFLNRSHTFHSNPQRFYNNIEYWEKGFELTNEIISNDPLDMLEYHSYVDFLEAQQETIGFTLKGRTPQSFQRLCDDWHRTVFLDKHDSYIHMKWPGMGIKAKSYVHEGYTFRFEELTAGAKLHEEGYALEHCVHLYAPRCELGYVSIWSMKHLNNEQYEPWITIEIQGNRIVQIAGKKNRRAHRLEMDVILAWAKEHNFLIAYL